MKLNEVQAVYYLLYRLAPEGKNHLIAIHDGKLITADFLSFYGTSSTPMEDYLTSDVEKKQYRIEEKFFFHLWQQWSSKNEFYDSTSEKISQSPDYVLSLVIKFISEYPEIPNFTNRVKNLIFLESGFKIPTAILEDSDFSLISWATL